MSVDMHGCDAKVGSQARLAWKAKDFTSLVVGSEIGHFGPATIAGTDNGSDGDIAEPPRNLPSALRTLSILQAGSAEEFAEPRV